MNRAKKRLSKEAEEVKVDHTRAEVALKRAINRLKLSGHYK
jgi:F0F1-type ATP synthase epsilon subunit